MNIRITVRWLAVLSTAFVALVGVSLAVNPMMLVQARPQSTDYTVGGACGANPIPVLIPCHRVLAANGKLGGFSGGLDWKRKLLARENVSV